MSVRLSAWSYLPSTGGFVEFYIGVLC